MSTHFNPMASPVGKRPGQGWPRLVIGAALGLVLVASAALVLTRQNSEIKTDLLALAQPSSEPEMQATGHEALPASSAEFEEPAEPETPIEPRALTKVPMPTQAVSNASTASTLTAAMPPPSPSAAPAAVASVTSQALAAANPEPGPSSEMPSGESLSIGPPSQAQLLARSQQAFAAQDHAQVLALSQNNPDLGLRRLAIASHQALDQHAQALQLGLSIPRSQRQDQDVLRLAISYESLAQKQSAIDFYQLFLRQSQHTELRQFAQQRLAQLKE